MKSMVSSYRCLSYVKVPQLSLVRSHVNVGAQHGLEHLQVTTPRAGFSVLQVA